MSLILATFYEETSENSEIIGIFKSIDSMKKARVQTIRNYQRFAYNAFSFSDCKIDNAKCGEISKINNVEYLILKSFLINDDFVIIPLLDFGNDINFYSLSINRFYNCESMLDIVQPREFRQNYPNIDLSKHIQKNN